MLLIKYFHWGLEDPTGKDDADFLETTDKITQKILQLKASLC